MMNAASRERLRALACAHVRSTPGQSVEIVRTVADRTLAVVYSRRQYDADPRSTYAAADIFRLQRGGELRRWSVFRRLNDDSAASRGPFDGLGTGRGLKANSRRNRRLVRKMQRLLFERHRVDEAVDRFFDVDRYYQHAPGAPDGVEFIRAGFQRRFSDHPFARSRLLHIVAEQDLVVTHRESQLGPDTEIRRVCDIFRIEGLRIIEHWDVTQSLSDSAAVLPLPPL